MTSLIRRHIKAPSLLISALFLASSGSTFGASQYGQASDAEANQVWKLADGLSEALNSSGEVGSFKLHAPLKNFNAIPESEATQSQTESAAKPLAAGSAIGAADPMIYTDETGTVVKAAAVKLSGTCISRKQFFTKYPEREWISGPTGHGPGTFVFRRISGKAQILYLFPEQAKDCMSQVVVKPMDES